VKFVILSYALSGLEKTLTLLCGLILDHYLGTRQFTFVHMLNQTAKLVQPNS